MTSINIPNSVTSIGNKAFYDCYFSTFVNNSSLDAESNNYWGAKICNNDGLVIEDNIIVDCAKWVTSINIPNSVTSIGYGAFEDCSGLTSIKVSWSRPLSISIYTFENIDKTNCILYVPKGTSTMYMVAPGWIDFVNIQEYADD